MNWARPVNRRTKNQDSMNRVDANMNKQSSGFLGMIPDEEGLLRSPIAIVINRNQTDKHQILERRNLFQRIRKMATHHGYIELQ